MINYDGLSAKMAANNSFYSHVIFFPSSKGVHSCPLESRLAMTSLDKKNIVDMT